MLLAVELELYVLVSRMVTSLSYALSVLMVTGGVMLTECVLLVSDVVPLAQSLVYATVVIHVVSALVLYRIWY